MVNKIKKIASLGLSAVILFERAAVGAGSLDSVHQSDKFLKGKSLASIKQKSEKPQKEESTWQKAKKKISESLEKTPKSVKKFGKLALISTPIVIGGRIIYVNKLKPTVDCLIGIKKIEDKINEIDSKHHKTRLDKMIIALLRFMPNCIMLGQSYEACLAQIDLLQLTSEKEIAERIGILNRDVLFSLSQIFQFENNLSLQMVGKLKQYYSGKISQEDLNCFDLLVSDRVEGLMHNNLKTWIGNVGKVVSKRLQELNQITLKKYGFTIKKSLGSGQAGEVYLCTDEDGQDVAVKVIPENGGLTSRISAKYENGVWKQVRDLESEHVMKYRSRFSKSGITCFSMEYVEGARELASVEPESLEQIIDWAKQIFEGLKALHERNLAHRDIKLENILLTNENKIKICDFGLAKKANSTSTACGSPAMMAPEILEQYMNRVPAHAYDGSKADVYSAALVIYCLVFGKRQEDIPNEHIDLRVNSDGFLMSMFGVTKLDENSPDRFNKGIGREMLQFFKKCLEKDPSSRATAAKALELLNKVN